MAELRVVCLLGQGFEDSELRVPYDRLRAAGVEVDIVGARAGEELRGYRGKETARSALGIDDVRPDQYVALLIPGGQSPDHLRADDRFVEFVKDFDRTGKPIAAVCHGPQLLISAELVRGRTLTAWKTIQADLRQMGANVKDEPVVMDRNWITSRQPGDLEPFSEALLAAIGAKEATAAGTGAGAEEVPPGSGPFARKGEMSVGEAAEEELPSHRPSRGAEQPGMRAGGDSQGSQGPLATRGRGST